LKRIILKVILLIVRIVNLIYNFFLGSSNYPRSEVMNSKRY
jgi:hypothetical protein